MDNTLINLLGYLTEQQWLDAFSQCDGININRSQLQYYARKINERYNCGWSEKLMNKIKA